MIGEGSLPTLQTHCFARSQRPILENARNDSYAAPGGLLDWVGAPRLTIRTHLQHACLSAVAWI